MSEFIVILMVIIFSIGILITIKDISKHAKK